MNEGWADCVLFTKNNFLPFTDSTLFQSIAKLQTFSPGEYFNSSFAYLIDEGHVTTEGTIDNIYFSDGDIIYPQTMTYVALTRCICWVIKVDQLNLFEKNQEIRDILERYNSKRILNMCEKKEFIFLEYIYEIIKTNGTHNYFSLKIADFNLFLTKKNCNLSQQKEWIDRLLSYLEKERAIVGKHKNNLFYIDIKRTVFLLKKLIYEL